MYDKEAFLTSWTKAVAANGQLRPWSRHFLSMPAKVSAMFPKDVVCIVGAQVIHDYANDRILLAANTLALDGYDLEASMSHWHRFMQQFPQFLPSTALLCTTDQLKDEYGPLWGPILANLVLYPEQQPIMYRLFFGELHESSDGPRNETYRIAQRRCWDVTWTMAMPLTSSGDPDEERATDWQQRGDRLLDPHTASFSFQHFTGRKLDTAVAIFGPFATTKE